MHRNDPHREDIGNNSRTTQDETSTPDSHRPHGSLNVNHVSPSTAVPQLSRLLEDGRGRFMFIGDAANLAFLKITRRLVYERIGCCPFTDDPMRHLMVEASPKGRPKWITPFATQIPAKPELTEARYLVRWYMRSAGCILNLFEETELDANMTHWVHEDRDSEDEDATSCILYLILALGAQASPDLSDDISENYFNRGRLLTAFCAVEDPTNTTIQSSLLITMYLLGASRRNSAYIQLGSAVRACYALGIHRKDFSSFFTPQEQAVRERLWKALRILDLFMSASLGRPPSTSETRDTAGLDDYSPSLDLSTTFESILTDVYAKRMVSTSDLERISGNHRRWAARFPDGLQTDGIQQSDVIESAHGTRYPNIGLYRLKGAYYWSIMLLSRPFLCDFVSRYAACARTLVNLEEDQQKSSAADQVLVYACVDSAIRCIDLWRGVLNGGSPRRLPFMTNAVFLSALILGLALFGDLDHMFPLEKNLASGQMLLRKFSDHDPVTSRETTIVERLQSACNSYLERRAQRKMERQGRLIGELFGSVHDRGTSYTEQHRPAFSQLRQNHHNAYLPPSPEMEGNSNLGRGVAVAPASNEAQGLQTLPQMTPLGDMMLPMSPRTLLFDSYDETMPFFPTVDVRDSGYLGDNILEDSNVIL